MRILVLGATGRTGAGILRQGQPGRWSRRWTGPPTGPPAPDDPEPSLLIAQ
jgi:hypothetical protein